jgi:diaminopimelate decarboxylase
MNFIEKLSYERPAIKKLESSLPHKFGMRSESGPLTHLDGVPVADLIRQFGSPVFVISEKTLRFNIQNAKRAFKTRYPKVQFAWSYKTNYLGAVCNVFHQEGSWAEVVSDFEYDKALSLGVEGRRIIFNGPDKSECSLEKAINNDSLIHIDHLDELYTIIEKAEALRKRPKVALRVNMDTGIHPTWDRFGFNYENGQAWEALNKVMVHENLELVGLHSHIGTFMISPQAYATAVYKLADLALGLRKKFQYNLKYLDLGGGFASSNTLKGSYLPGSDSNPTVDDFAEAITTALTNCNFLPDELPLLILETGRALVDDAAYLLGSVVANKRLASGKRATILDVGVNILFTAFWYDHKISPAQPYAHSTEDVVVYGPLCMNIDVIRENVNLPLLNKDDHVVIHHVGAYNMTQWMQFIQLRPKVIMIDQNGTPQVIRDHEMMETVAALESVPEHLRQFILP